jgi:hypothetical protein
MGVNQGPGDPLLSAASADDQQQQLQNLQEEVDQIKVSIKRLLMDIRERMNELENPFVHNPEIRNREGGRREEVVSKKTSLEQEGTSKEEINSEIKIRPSPAQEGEHGTDPVVAAIKEQLQARISNREGKIQPEKLRLTKVHQIFEWTSWMVRRYGHDRLDMMLQSYRVMGYLTKESCEQVQEISRLMPASLGESHEIGPDEFIKQLYALNQILDPADTTLDRDMIQVLLEQQRRKGVSHQPLPLKEKETQEDWIRMPDGV